MRHSQPWLASVARLAAGGRAGARLARRSRARRRRSRSGSSARASATHWPIYSGLKQGYYDAADIKLDMIFTPSSGGAGAAARRRLARCRALDRHRRSDLRHRQGRADRDRAARSAVAALCPDRQALDQEHQGAQGQDHHDRRPERASPRSMSSACWRRTASSANEFDPLFAGATAARFAALQSGAIDATVLLPPFNFYAETAGFANLGLTIDYTPDLPFQRRGREHEVGGEATAPCSTGCSRCTTRAWPGSWTRRTATRPSRSWSRPASRSARTSPTPTTSCCKHKFFEADRQGLADEDERAARRRCASSATSRPG